MKDQTASDEDLSDYCADVLTKIGNGSTFGVTLQSQFPSDVDMDDSEAFSNYLVRHVNSDDRVLGHPAYEIGAILRELDALGMIEVQHGYGGHRYNVKMTDWYSPIAQRTPAPPYSLSWDRIVYLPPWCHATVRITERGLLALDKRKSYRPRADRPAGLGRDRHVERECFTPTEDDVAILLEISRAGTTLVQVAIEAGTHISRKTVGARLKVLFREGLIAYPHGKNKGAALTASGTQLLEHLASEIPASPAT